MVGYPRHSLGRTFACALARWGVPEARLAAYLGLTHEALAALALCPAPGKPDAPAGAGTPERTGTTGTVDGFDRRVDSLAEAFGVDRWRLDFLCRAAAGEPSRLRG